MKPMVGINNIIILLSWYSPQGIKKTEKDNALGRAEQKYQKKGNVYEAVKAKNTKEYTIHTL